MKADGIRVAIRIDPALLADLDALVAATPDANRSQMIRGAVRLLIEAGGLEGLRRAVREMIREAAMSEFYAANPGRRKEGA